MVDSKAELKFVLNSMMFFQNEDIVSSVRQSDRLYSAGLAGQPIVWAGTQFETTHVFGSRMWVLGGPKTGDVSRCRERRPGAVNSGWPTSVSK